MTLNDKAEVDAVIAALSEAGWIDVQHLDTGGTGIVCKARQPTLERGVAIKVLKPTLAAREITGDDGESLGSYASSFSTEVSTLASLQHRTIMEIYAAGELSTPSGPAPYYVMPLREPPYHLYTYLDNRGWSDHSEATTWLNRALTEAATALGFLHSRGRVHRDVKGNNVMVDGDGHCQLTDFGSVKVVVAAEGNTVSMSDAEYLHPQLREYLRSRASDKRREYLLLPRRHLFEFGVAYDLYALGVTVEKMIGREIFSDSPLLTDLRLLVRQLKAAGTRETPRIESATQLIQCLKRIQPGAVIASALPELGIASRHTIRLPPALAVPVSDGIKAVIDSPLLRRLRRVKQLALVDEVYPGATHTRLSHCIGVHYWTREYLRMLWHDPRDAYVREVARPRDMRALLVAALCHDIGQYPFAHAAEGVDPNLFGHEALGCALLDTRSEDHQKLPGEVRAQVTELGEIVEHEFDGTRLADVLDILQGYPVTGEMDPNIREVFHRILNGPLDADKADYVMRDAYYTGLGGHDGPDPLFLGSLTTDDTRHGIGLLPTGRDAAESLILLRYRLFKWVYWHRTVRGIESVVMEVIERLLRERGDEWAWKFKIEALRATEASLLEWLVDECIQGAVEQGYVDALQAIQKRRLYTRICTIAPLPGANEDAYAEDTELYRQMTRLKNQWAGGQRGPLTEALTRFRKAFNLKVGQNLGPMDVLVDIPIPNRHSVGTVKIVDASSGDGRSIADSSHIWESIGEDFEHLARRVRVYVAPWTRQRIGRGEVVALLHEAFLGQVRRAPTPRSGA